MKINGILEQKVFEAVKNVEADRLRVYNARSADWTKSEGSSQAYEISQ